ncbi:FKBP-type peptidyl-prolyl cis-trans isomerase slyD [Kluyvera cryocrescens]|uniref:FKBP-type peptidyl-prolyl cis-trans isomerase slyD n=1 Tax=Kluyvera cryocrescens TaxID=580 RepID=A0A485AE61_KLUCR|nr:FKBP-type peptidyl-prolyl cis-trans isomerase slyD [Kluyvera cryocrescens]
MVCVSWLKPTRVQFPLKSLKWKTSTVVVDGNHMLAGQNLKFNVEVCRYPRKQPKKSWLTATFTVLTTMTTITTMKGCCGGHGHGHDHGHEHGKGGCGNGGCGCH